MQVDKYARDTRPWRDFAKVNHTAAQKLFADVSPFMYFPAAGLGHHAIEMYLKAALIKHGMTVFNPNLIGRLDAGLVLSEAECAWGHSLLDLAKLLARRTPLFDLSYQVNFPAVILNMPMEVGAALEYFEPFFDELRYPVKLSKLQGVGEEEGHLLDELVSYIEPFSA